MFFKYTWGGSPQGVITRIVPLKYTDLSKYIASMICKQYRSVMCVKCNCRNAHETWKKRDTLRNIFPNRSIDLTGRPIHHSMYSFWVFNSYSSAWDLVIASSMWYVRTKPQRKMTKPASISPHGKIKRDTLWRGIGSLKRIFDQTQRNYAGAWNIRCTQGTRKHMKRGNSIRESIMGCAQRLSPHVTFKKLYCTGLHCIVLKYIL